MAECQCRKARQPDGIRLSLLAAGAYPEGMKPVLPDPHQAFLDHLIEALTGDARFIALLGCGSMIHGGFDIWSDLDFTLVVEEAAYEDIMASREAFAASLGGLLSAFTGEHVGEPRLLICLYGEPLLHVDFKFVRLLDLNQLVEKPIILWSDRNLERVFEHAEIAWPNRSPEWFEARVWIWLHYGATKWQRGEWFEAIGMLAFLREQVLGPMLSRRAGKIQRGVRRIEQLGDLATARLLATAPGHQGPAIRDALEAAASLYLDLRADEPPYNLTPKMPEAFLDFISR